MRYHNFDLWIEEKDGSAYHLRALTETFESARGLMQLDLDSAEIINATERFVRRQTDHQFMVHVGTLLYNALFSPEDRAIDSLFQEYSGRFLNPPHDGIRLRLRIEAPEIAALPWEFLYSPLRDTFFSTWICNPLVRYLDVRMPIPALETSPPIRILIVIPSSPDIDATEEKSVLLSALKDAEPHVRPTFLEGKVSLARIEEAFDEERFHIFHFIGHGDFIGEQGVLRLCTETVDHNTLGRLFQNHEDMKLVFLNACKGAQVSPSKPFLGIAPQLVKRGVPAVVAMQYSIYDDIAVHFSRKFYHSLFKGKHRGRIDMALTQARNSLSTHYPDERAFGAPVLFLRSPDGVLFNLPPVKAVPVLPVSASEAHRLEAVAQTHRHNIDVIEDSKVDAQTKMAKIQDAEMKIKQIRQTLKYRRISLAAALTLAVLVLVCFWMNIFDYFTLDTRIESYTIAMGDLFVHKQLHEDIILISIDKNKAKEEIGRSYEEPWAPWRKDHAMLLDKLSQAGAKVVAFDIAFESLSESDAALRDAMIKARERGTSVIVSTRKLQQGEPLMSEELSSAISGWGVPLIGKRLGYARLAPLVIRKETEPNNVNYVPGLAMRLFAAYNSGDNIRVEYIDPKRNEIMVRFDPETPEPKKLGFFELDKIGRGAGYSGILGKGDTLANLAIDLTPLHLLRDKSRRYSYTYIRDHPEPETLTQLRNKIVIVGIENENDFYRDRWGFELHADAVNTLLNGVVIRSVGWGGQFALIVIFSIVGAIIRTRTRRASRRLPILLLLIVLLIYLMGTIYLYTQYRLLLNTLYHIVALFLTYQVVGKLERRYFP